MNFLKKIFPFDSETDYQHALKEDMLGDKKKAFWLFEKSAEKNHAGAQFYCGYMSLYGRGTPKDINKAFTFINKSANQGYYKAQYLLSQMYLFGVGIYKNKTEGDKWLERAKESAMDLSKLSFLDLYEDFE